MGIYDPRYAAAAEHGSVGDCLTASNPHTRDRGPMKRMGGGGDKMGDQRKLSQSLLFTAFYMGLAFLFGVGLYIYGGKKKALEFTAAYLVEQSLSVDNLFVFLITFKYFLVPPELQPRVLTWGIIGAVLMRGLMIVAGVKAVQRFKSIILIFAAILLVSAVKLFFENGEPEELSNNMILRISKRVVGAVDVSARLTACLTVCLT